MRRFSLRVKEIKDLLGKEKDKTFMENQKHFKILQKRIRKKFRQKYYEPYIYKYVNKDDLPFLKPYQIPTYFQYYTACDLVANKKTHLNSVLKDFIQLNNEKEFLKKYHFSSFTNIYLKHAFLGVNFTFHSNLFPQDLNILKILEKREINKRKIISIQESKFESSVQIDSNENEKKPIQNDISFSSNMNTQLESSRNMLEFLLQDCDNSSSENDVQIKSNFLFQTKNNEKRKEIEFSVQSIEKLINEIKDNEEERERIRPVRKPVINLKTKKKVFEIKKKKFMLTEIKSNFPTISRKTRIYQTFKLDNRLKLTLQNGHNDKLYHDFKNTGDFFIGKDIQTRRKEEKKNLIAEIALRYNSLLKKEKPHKKNQRSTRKSNGTIGVEKVSKKRIKSTLHNFCETSVSLQSQFCDTLSSRLRTKEKTLDSISSRTTKLLNKSKVKIRMEDKALRKKLLLGPFIRYSIVSIPEPLPIKSSEFI